MSKSPSAARWQNIAWNSLFLRIPASWQPTVIYPQYLFFEMEGRPVFEIKWQSLPGRFSGQRALDQIGNTMQKGTLLDKWEVPPAIQCTLQGYVIEGFQLRHAKGTCLGMVVYCQQCERVTLLQWHIDTEDQLELLTQIAASFHDHTDTPQQTWSIYDFRALLPQAVKLVSHEFLPGRYTLRFHLDRTAITLYRFKPAKVLLAKKTIGGFGQELLNRDPVEQTVNSAQWDHRYQGLSLLLAKVRRQPAWKWMRLWHDREHNAILGVRAEGKGPVNTAVLQWICENYVSLDTV